MTPQLADKKWLSRTDDEMELFMAERQRVCHVCYRRACDGNCQANAYSPALAVKEVEIAEERPQPSAVTNKRIGWGVWLTVAGVLGYFVWFWASAILEATL